MSFLKSEKTKSLINYVAIGFVAFIILVLIRSTMDVEQYTLPRTIGQLGALLGLFRWGWINRKRISIDKFVGTLANNYNLTTYVTPTIITFLYVSIQGALIGASFGFLLDWGHAIFKDAYLYSKNESLMSALACYVIIVVVRLNLEFLKMVYNKLSSD